MMENFIIGAVAGVIVTAVVLRVALHLAVRRAEKTLEALEQAIENLQANMIPARVEQHDGMFYVYNARDNSFIAQGTSLAELRSRIEGRMKDAHVVVQEGDPAVLEALKATQNA
jgi:vancomycin resistance protein YoaR